jgi:SAM-dependent methyltransferase
MNGPSSFSPLHVDYNDKYGNLPRMDILGLLDFRFGSILEIGCGGGATGQVVKQKYPGVTYCGVEKDAAAAANARVVLDGVVTGNIEEMDLEHYDIRSHSFDVIICADVLEHLYDPWRALQTFHRYLQPDGRVVATIPNVQNVQVLRDLAGGRWTYKGSGLLDATHIRFFTLYEIRQLFGRNGYTVEQVLGKYDADMPTGGPWPRDIDLGTMILKQVTAEDVQQLFTFQYLIRARSTAAGGGAS